MKKLGADFYVVKTRTNNLNRPFTRPWQIGICRGAGGVMSIVEGRAKICVDADTKARFDQVAGINDAKVKFQKIVEFLKHTEDHGAPWGWISEVCGTFFEQECYTCFQAAG